MSEKKQTLVLEITSVNLENLAELAVDAHFTGKQVMMGTSRVTKSLRRKEVHLHLSTPIQFYSETSLEMPMLVPKSSFLFENFLT